MKTKEFQKRKHELMDQISYHQTLLEVTPGDNPKWWQYNQEMNALLSELRELITVDSIKHERRLMRLN